MIKSRWRQFFELLILFMLVIYGMNLLTLTVFTRETIRFVNVRAGIFGLINFLEFYIFFRWAVSKYFPAKDWLRFSLVISGNVIVFNLFRYAMSFLLFPKIQLYQGYRYDLISKQRIEVYITFKQYFLMGLWTGFVLLLAAFAWYYFKHWLDEDHRRALLQQQKAKAESGFLKMQLNSHFLINSLNSIYSLSLVGSPEVVSANRTLAQLISYMVNQPDDITYRCSIKEELAYLEDYISLQTLRTGCPEGVQVNFQESLPGKSIAPLLLVPFVENAFKHGVTNQAQFPVVIELEADEASILFKVRNKKSTSHKDKVGGIGLENVRKRLELIYPGKHELVITETEVEYFSSLMIKW